MLVYAYISINRARKMKEATKMAMDYFLRSEQYTAEKLEADYLAELAKYSNDNWEAPQRAARLSAAVKRYKTSEMIRFIFATIAHEFDPDLTPITVKRLCKALFGRTGSQWLIVAVFGQAGRQHRSDDSNPEKIEQMAARYRRDAQKQTAATLAEIARVKLTYQKGIRASRSKAD